MRVLQLIDTLEAGGAERMAVNLANALESKIEVSYLCSTRQEGMLKLSLNENVSYVFLNKKKTIDVNAIIRLYKFIKQERIDIIHAHSSSFFLATLISWFLPKLKIIWHDHYGNSKFLNSRPKRILRFCSSYFSHSFAVNMDLVDWANTYLKHKSVSYLSNFIQLNKESKLNTKLKGKSGKRIICLANLRPQKDHFNLIKAFSKIVKDFPEYTLHCVGKDFEDEYSKQIFDLIKSKDLASNVFFYGSRSDVHAILSSCDIGVLSSKSEGLPLALLEYGLVGLPVVVTSVGDCNLVVENKLSGLLVKPEDSEALYSGLHSLISNYNDAKKMGIQLSQTIATKYSESAAINTVIKWYKAISLILIQISIFTS